MFSFLSIVSFLVSNMISQGNYVNYLSFNDSKTLDFSVNMLQTKTNTYVVKDLADWLWKSQDQISSLWFVETCSDTETTLIIEKANTLYEIVMCII